MHEGGKHFLKKTCTLELVCAIINQHVEYYTASYNPNVHTIQKLNSMTGMVADIMCTVGMCTPSLVCIEILL